MTEKEIKKSTKGHSSHVRFSPGEHTSLELDSVNTGKSIPQLLKESYFERSRPLPLMTKPDLAKISGELGRIGNNMNQIAKRLNSGIRAGFNEDIKVAQESLDRIWVFLSSRYCRCKQPTGC